MEIVTIFNSKEFGDIRTVQLNNEVYFVGKDVATALGYANPKNAVPTHVSEEDKLSTQIEYAGQRREVTVINESGLYALIFGSKLESAKRFKYWVTSEVLPSLRKNKGYFVDQENMGREEIMAAGLKVAQQIIDEKNTQIEQMRPKEVFADAVAASDQSMLVGELAKLISQNGKNIGQKKLFAWMRDNGYLISQGRSYNMPKQKYIEQGLFAIKENIVTNRDGTKRQTYTTTVTGKGQQYFINKFLE